MKKLAASVLATAMMAFGLVLVAPAGPAAAADVAIDLYAVAGFTTLPDGTPGGTTVPVWGYNASGAPATAPGGPTIEVNQDDVVTVTLHNAMGVDTGLIFRGQDMVPDFAGVGSPGTKEYTFTASRPGTYLYEAGLLPGAQYQTSMGLYGALVVNPSTAGQAYAGADSAHDQDAVMLLGEVDPALNNAANPAAFDMRKFNPKYSLMNGTAYPDTADVVVQSPATEQRVLLRYLNAGTQYRSMAALGAAQRVIALDGNQLEDPRTYVSETFGPGQTADAIVTTPAQAENAKRIAIYDGSLLLHNSNAAGTGGMLTFLTVPGSNTAGTDTAGPVTSDVAYSGGTLTATIDDTTTGGVNVQAAEYYLDDASVTATPLTGTFATVSVDASAAVTIASGKHILYVRGQDALGNWGVFSSVLVDAGDADGPVTRDAKLVRNPTNGDVNVKLHATCDDRKTGKSNVAQAEYRVDEGNAYAMNVNRTAVVASLDAVIPSSLMGTLAEGERHVSIRCRDDAGANNWGEWLTVLEDPALALVVDRTAPEATALTVDPNPNNGTMAINTSSQAVRVQARLDDPIVAGVNSNIRKAEAFLDTIGADNKGIQMAAVDGVFDGFVDDVPDPTGEPAYADIPLATIQQLGNGEHTLYVHAQDRARNWNDTFATVILLIDKSGPTVTNVSAAPNPTQGANAVTLEATATDAWSTVTAVEWWIAPNPGTGNGTAMVLSGSTWTDTIDVSSWDPGAYRIRVRAKDALGNWGRRSSTVLVVNQ
ncbi:MAG: multicopper oxidase domain-containing protein [Actinomycetes bacterium]